MQIYLTSVYSMVACLLTHFFGNGNGLFFLTTSLLIRVVQYVCNGTQATLRHARPRHTSTRHATPRHRPHGQPMRVVNAAMPRRGASINLTSRRAVGPALPGLCRPCASDAGVSEKQNPPTPFLPPPPRPRACGLGCSLCCLRRGAATSARPALPRFESVLRSKRNTV